MARSTMASSAGAMCGSWIVGGSGSSLTLARMKLCRFEVSKGRAPVSIS